MFLRLQSSPYSNVYASTSYENNHTSFLARIPEISKYLPSATVAHYFSEKTSDGAEDQSFHCVMIAGSLAELDGGCEPSSLRHELPFALEHRSQTAVGPS